jgi:hypothetical protein
MAKFILRSELNMLITAILRTGISTKELTLSCNSKDTLTIPLPLKFSINDTPFYFEISYFWKNYYATFFPGLSATAATEVHQNIKSLSDDISGWANRVARELSEPDPWSLLGENRLPQPELFDKTGDNEKFNERDLRIIKESLQEIRRFLVSEMKPDVEHSKAIDERLSFLEKETQTQNKKQWMYVAIGVIVTIADGLAMSPDQAHKLFGLLSDLFRHLVVKLLS